MGGFFYKVPFQQINISDKIGIHGQISINFGNYSNSFRAIQTDQLFWLN